MKLVETLSVALAACCVAASDAAPPIGSARELAQRVVAGESGRAFALEGIVSYLPEDGNIAVTFAAQDASGGVAMINYSDTAFSRLRAGDRVRVLGETAKSGEAWGMSVAICRSCAILSHGEPPAPEKIGTGELFSGRFDFRLVEMQGVVRDAFRDDIDPAWTYLVLNCGENVYATFPFSGDTGRLSDSLVGAKVLVTGFCNYSMVGARRPYERFLMLGGTNSVHVLEAPPADPFDVPSIDDVLTLRASEMSGAGRRRVSGRVVAAWRGRNMLIRTENGENVRVETAEEDVLPACGESVDVVGIPATDFYSVNLTGAKWRTRESSGASLPAATNVTAKAIMEDSRGRRRFNYMYHGRAVSMAGTVRGRQLDPDNKGGTLILESDGHLVPVDLSACPEAAADAVPGAKVLATGTCVMETENWSAVAAFPRIKGFIVVARGADDIVVVERAPWWTPFRLFVAVMSLAATLLAIFVWNILLRRVAERRGRELAKASVSQVESEIKVFERTRLAVELHDSIAQNLTGVSLELRTAGRTIDSSPQDAKEHVRIACKALDSCKTELRNCLWDLRSNTLESPDMEDAIRCTIAHHLDSAKLALRFRVPRERLTDNTAHNILCIVRELAVNAVRHGKASEIRIAGSIENGTLRFSVRDNGCGFNPAECPGTDEGHFGLQGVRERIKPYGGKLDIESSPGAGTKATVSIRIPDSGERKTA